MSEVDVVHCWHKYWKFIVVLKYGVCVVCLQINLSGMLTTARNNMFTIVCIY